MIFKYNIYGQIRKQCKAGNLLFMSIPLFLYACQFSSRFLGLFMSDWLNICSLALSGWVESFLPSGPSYVYFLFAKTLIDFHVEKFSSKISRIVYGELIWYLIWCIIRVSCTMSPFFRSVICLLSVCRSGGIHDTWIHFLFVWVCLYKWKVLG